MLFSVAIKHKTIHSLFFVNPLIVLLLGLGLRVPRVRQFCVVELAVSDEVKSCFLVAVWPQHGALNAYQRLEPLQNIKYGKTNSFLQQDYITSDVDDRKLGVVSRFESYIPDSCRLDPRRFSALLIYMLKMRIHVVQTAWNHMVIKIERDEAKRHEIQRVTTEQNSI
jgi:hypothetical protein